MRGKGRGVRGVATCGWLAGLAVLAALAPPAAAEVGLQRVLQSLSVDRAQDGWMVRVDFNTPVRYLRHSPARRGETLQIQIQPIALSPLDVPSLSAPQSLAPPAGLSIPLLDVSYEGSHGDGRYLVFHFARVVAYEVMPARDFRGIVVHILDVRAPALRRAEIPPPPGPEPPGAAPAPTAPTPTATPRAAELPPSPAPEAPAPAPPPRAAPAEAPVPPAASADVATWVAEARVAMTDGDLEKAIRLLTKAVSLPEAEGSREAKELLGLARERNGQLAHAKAEYREYLARWPEGDGAVRVRQRLDALLTAQAKLPPPPGAPARAPGRTRYGLLGSTAMEYRREQRSSDLLGSYVADSSLYSDGTFVLRATTPGWALRGQAAGSYRYDFVDTGSRNNARLASLFLDAKQLEGPWAGMVGRQPGNTGGVLSRFDGLRMTHRLGEHWRVGGLVGMPVDYWRTSRVQLGRSVYGVSLDADHLFGHLDGQLFAVQQRSDGVLDRTAVGGELRYADDSRFLAAFLDYDVQFLSLNTVLLVGNWQLGPNTSLNGMVDFRNSPILTATNAIQGQNANDVGDLSRIYSQSEIEALARDRTARSTVLSLGGTRRLGERFEVALDVSASKISGTPGSGGVDPTEGTDWELSVYPQLVVSDWLREGHVTTLGVRWFNGTFSDTVSLIVNDRLPITRALRLRPRLRVDWRNQAGRDEFLPRPDDPNATDPSVISATRVHGGSWTVRPYLGAEYRFGRFTLDTDGGVEWTTGSFDAAGGDELAWILSFGVRYDF